MAAFNEADAAAEARADAPAFDDPDMAVPNGPARFAAVTADWVRCSQLYAAAVPEPVVVADPPADSPPRFSTGLQLAGTPTALGEMLLAHMQLLLRLKDVRPAFFL